MESASDLGKLFIGGISWDTDEERLQEYFGKYGDLVEAVIMRDRTTGRARGFGFIVFADPSVAERVIMDKHIIDGRTVSNLGSIACKFISIISLEQWLVLKSPSFCYDSVLEVLFGVAAHEIIH